MGPMRHPAVAALALALVLITGAATLGGIAAGPALAVLVGLGVVVWVGLLYRRTRLGGARWASLGELARAGWTDSAGWPLGHRGVVPVYLPEVVQRENVMALAPPGAGKTRGVLVPALLSEARRPPPARRSVLVVDPVGELHALTAATLATTHRVLVWNPSNPAVSTCRFDPLAYLPPPDDPGFVSACETAAMIWLAATHDPSGGAARRGMDPYWEKQAANLMKALVIAYAARYPDVTIGDLMTWFMPLGSDDLQEALLDPASPRAAQYRAHVLADLLKNEKAEGGVFGEIRERFMLLVNPTVAATMGRPSIDFAECVTIPTALYVQVGVGDAHLQPLLSVFISTAINQLVRLTSAGQPLGREVRFIVDELANLGRIHDLAGGLATLRKYGLGFLMATQTRARLIDRYGENEADAIMQTCGTVLGLGGLAYEDAVWVSRQLGIAARRAGGGSFSVRLPAFNPMGAAAVIGGGMMNVSGGQQVRQEQLMSPDEIRAMQGRMIVLPTRLRPSQVSLELHTG